jgi:hypothetical protein
VLAGPETRLDRDFEQVGEVALRELGTDVGAVACFLEQVRVGVERHARSGVAEDGADLGDVESDVDDQVAGKGVAQIVETQPPPVAIETRVDGRPTQYPLRHVVVQERRAMGGGEHVIEVAVEAGAAFVLTENRCELGEERDLTDGGARLRWDAVRRHTAAATRELVTDVDDAGSEVDVVPAEPEHLGEAHAGVRAGEEQRPIPPCHASKSRVSSERVRTRWSERCGCGRSSRSSRWKGCVEM